MRIEQRVLAAVIVILAACSAGRIAAAPPDAPLEVLEEQAFKQATALAAPSVVRIQTVGGLDVVGRRLTGTGPTTGVVVSDDGYIMTSAVNFVSKPDSILVELPDGRRFPAKRVATDHLRRLALLKIEATGLQPAEAAPKDSIRVGQWAIALGRTYQLAVPGVSVGIVSAVNRIWGKAVQTDAKVSPVNYGGPLIDLHGRTLGILVPLSPKRGEETAGVEWYDSGIGFAIPMDDVYAILGRLKEGEDLHPGLMGISLRGRSLLVGEPVIDRVRIQSPADKAGLRPGDRLVEIDDRPVNRPADVKYALGTKYAGDSVSVSVRRNGETIRAELTLVAKLLPYESGFLGILPVRPPVDGETEPSRPAPLPVGEGRAVRVRYVYPESPASEAGLQPQDRIVRFHEQDVADAASLRNLVGRLRPGETTTLTFRREGVERTIDVELASIPASVPPQLPTAVIPSPPRDNSDGDAQQPADNTPEQAPDGADVSAQDSGVEDPDPDEDELEIDAQREPTREAKSTAANSNTAVQTGRFTATLPNSDQSYWAYVPDDYNPAYAYGLMVWLHPDGDTMEAAIFRRWRSICDRRGIIILAPKATEISGWTPNDAEVVKESVEQMTETYTVDPARIFLHGFSEGGRFAYHLAFKYRDVFRGVAAAASPLAEPPPENDPDHRLQFHLVCGRDDNVFDRLEETVEALRRLKYPVSFTPLSGHGHVLPPAEPMREIGRWADALDRI